MFLPPFLFLLRKEYPNNISTLCMDIVENKEAAKESVEFMKSNYGGVDILINNAANQKPNTLLHNIEEKDWDDVISIILTAPFRFCKYSIQNMKISSFKFCFPWERATQLCTILCTHGMDMAPPPTSKTFLKKKFSICSRDHRKAGTYPLILA